MSRHRAQTSHLSWAGTALLCGVTWLLSASAVPAQEARPGPITPPPEHNVRRMGTEAKPEAPPPVPPEQIIHKFSQKEDEFLTARARYGYHKTIRVQEFDDQGKVSGEFEVSTEPVIGSDGKLYEKVVAGPPSTLRILRLEPEDLESLGRIPAFPLTTSQLSKYDLTYAGKEQVDEVNCYLFRVKPKVVERTRAYFEGLVWVEDQDLEVVRTYGKWVTELGEVHSPTLPFTLFDTYRENVEGKYWFPAYSRSDDSIRLKDGEVRVRLVIRWADYKPLAAPVPAAPKPKS
jgi:hypothetical protein